MTEQLQIPTRVGVVGGGIMGSGIAEVLARADLDVIVVDTDPAAIERSRARVRGSLAKAVARGKLDAAAEQRALDRLRWAGALDPLADRQLVVEAVVERRDVKLDIFTTLGQIVDDPSAVLASNTSSIPIVELGVASGRGEQVVGMHFFNPAPVMSLVEVVPSLLTDSATTRRVQALARDVLGKQPVVAPDRAGFTVNALLIPYLLSAIRMLEQGLASAEDIDMGMVSGCGHPMGPLALSDLIGLDTVKGVADTLYAEHREQLFAPPPLLQRLVAAGLLGRKTGRGVYQYD